jgi:hypothetical protein
MWAPGFVLGQPKTLPGFRGFFLTATTQYPYNNIFRAFAAQFERASHVLRHHS